MFVELYGLCIKTEQSKGWLFIQHKYGFALNKQIISF